MKTIRIVLLILATVTGTPTTEGGWCGSDSDCELVFGPDRK